MIRYIVLVLVAFSLSCATVWQGKRGQSVEQFEEDVSECMARAGTATTGLAGWAAYNVRNRVYRACMHGRGWEET